MNKPKKKRRYKIRNMWEVLEEAAKDRRKCFIRYKKRGTHKKKGRRDERGTYLVAPYSFRNKPGGEVLFAYDFGSRRIKSFFKDGVTGVHVSQRRFRPKWDVEIEREFVMSDVYSSFYRLAMLNKTETMDDFLSAGRSVEAGLTEGDVDPEQLKRGIEVEMEHTKDPDTAKKIALDHLAEFRTYYTALDEMEERLREESSS